MKQKLILMASMLLSGVLVSQSVPKALEEWSTTDGTQNFFYKNITKTDASGNVIVAGATMNNGFPDILVAKYNSSGTLLWTQQFAGTAPNGVDFAAGLYVTTNDVYITGAVSNNSVIPETDCVTMRLASSTGSVVWSSTYSGAAGSHDGGKDVIVDGSGNVFISGASYNASFNTDYLAVAYNNSGTQQWANTWDYTGADDGSYKIAISGSNLNVSGAVTTATASVYKMATIRFTQSTGSLVATSVSTAVTTTSVDAVTDMLTDGSGNVIICGSVDAGVQGHDFYVQKLSASTLASQWTYTWDGPSSLSDYAKAVAIDGSGNVFVAGFSNSSTLGRELTLIKLNSSGVYQWEQQSGFSGDDEAADLAVDANDDVYVTGYKTSATKNYYTAKYDNSGTKVWEVEMDGNSADEDYATNMAIDALDNIIITGQSKTGTGDYEFLTVKYVQKEVITPTDLDGEVPAPNFMYYRNSGQIIAASATLTPVPDVRFYTNNTYPAFYFKNRSQSFVFAKIDTAGTSPSDTLHRIDLDFNNANEGVETFAMDEQENGYLNYFLAHTGTNGIANVKGNQRLITPDLYPNIDLMCSSNQNGIKYYFIIKPGGDIRDIQMEFTGADSYSLNVTTNALTLNGRAGSMTYDKPIAYQLTAGNSTVAVTGWTPDWQTNGAANKYRFNDGAYTSSLTLVIEVDQGNTVFTNSSVQNIKWSTYLGKTGEERVNKLRTDVNNNLFAVGQTNSAAFPQTGPGFFQANLSGLNDGVISKFDAINQLVWSTYVGGTGGDRLTDVAFHSTGDLYCVGGTGSTNLPAIPKTGADNDASYNGPSGPFNTGNLINDSFIFQLSQTGATCSWLRYYGGDYYDEIRACTIDANDNFFIAGFSSSSDLPTIYSGTSYHQGNSVNGSVAPGIGFDGIIARFNSNSVITWATYIGSSLPSGDCRDYIYDIVIGRPSDFPTEDIFITGTSFGNNYPNTPTLGSSNYTNASTASDVVVSRFSNTGDLRWSTYAGGLYNDMGYALAYGNDRLYVTGQTSSSDFLAINSGTDYTQNHGGMADAFYMVINDLNQIIHSTPVGGSDSDYGRDIVYDKTTGTAYISAICNGSHFPVPVSNPLNTYDQPYAGSADNVIFALRDNNAPMLWGTYLGGANDEGYSGNLDDYYSQSICLDGNNNLYLGGATSTSQTQSPAFPLDNGGGTPVYFQPILGGQYDATITKFNLVPVNAVGLAENQEPGKEAFIYPNPASTMLFVKLNAGLEKTSYKIINTMGQVVGSGSIQSELNPIPIDGLVTGVYIIELTNHNSNFCAKFIKRD